MTPKHHFFHFFFISFSFLLHFSSSTFYFFSSTYIFGDMCTYQALEGILFYFCDNTVFLFKEFSSYFLMSIVIIIVDRNSVLHIQYFILYRFTLLFRIFLMTSLLEIYLNFQFRSNIKQNNLFDENKISQNCFVSDYDFNSIFNKNQAQKRIKFDFLEVGIKADAVLRTLR